MMIGVSGAVNLAILFPVRGRAADVVKGALSDGDR